MDKPDCDVLNDMVRHIEEYRDLKERITAKKEILKSSAHRLSDVEKSSRLRSAIYAYWMLPEIPADDIAFGLQGTRRNKHFMELIGSVTVGIECDICRQTIPIKSRTQIAAEINAASAARARYAEGHKNLCKSCWGQVKKERSTEHKRGTRTLENQRLRLQALPYAQYRRTVEWERAQAQHFELLRRVRGLGAKLECDLCKSDDHLSLRHKSQTGVGRESFDDMILLCGDCTELLAGAGRILT